VKWLCAGIVALGGCSGQAFAPGADGGGSDGADTADGAVDDLAAAAPDLTPPFVDRDLDGLDDALELDLAKRYLPFLSLSPKDGCPRGGLVVRVSPHAKDAKLLHVVYDWLYEQDCGLNGHTGDDEAFATTIDPARPPPDGLVALIAISHQGTPCERTSQCGQCMGQTACETLTQGGKAWPALWPSRDKHGSYVNRSKACTTLTTCFDTCEDNPSPAMPAIVNVGEPTHPMVHDLTDEGFITAANGWTKLELFHFDPWGNKDFGGAGNVTGDLTDPAFDTPACP
jgi:hypothetical protein